MGNILLTSYLLMPLAANSAVRQRFGFPELALVGITVIWGATFLIIKNAVTPNDAFGFVGIRFGVAAALCALMFSKHLRSLTKAELLAGAAIGASIFAGYSLQTYALNFISSSKSAFITGFYVPLVPLLQWLFLRRAAPWATWVAIIIAFIGVTLLAGPDGLEGGFGKGELLTALGALAISAEILLISVLGKGLHAGRVTVVQLFFASAIAFAFVPIVDEALPVLSSTFLISAVALGSASALIQFVMNWAQKRVSATKATLIYAGEPVWAGIAGKLAGERITGLAVVGALMIVAASLLSEWRPSPKSESEAG